MICDVSVVEKDFISAELGTHSSILFQLFLRSFPKVI